MFGLFKSLFGEAIEEVREALKQNAFLVDVRTRSEFDAGSAKGAVNIPLNKIESQLNQFQNKNGIVVFCQSGARCGQAKRILESHGINNIINGGSLQNVKKALND